jgi:hypothetical protein
MIKFHDHFVGDVIEQSDLLSTHKQPIKTKVIIEALAWTWHGLTF